MSLDAYICALMPVVIIAAIVLRAVLVRRRNRGLVREGVPYSRKDQATTGYEAGRSPVEADKWWPPQ
jgi:NADH:ubiquinone oxidoreductase subunit 3 (subunit A)